MSGAGKDSPSLAPSEMAASVSGAGKDSMMVSEGKALVDAKIKEGIFKVQEIRRLADEEDRDIEALQKEVDGMAAVIECELQLDEYCCDLSDMRKARQVYRVVELSDAEERSLCEIYDLANSAIDDYIARVGPVPSYDSHVSLFSETIPLEFPEPLEKAFPRSSSSHYK
ncbi:unnamed protein product [Alopecurus aequalis]